MSESFVGSNPTPSANAGRAKKKKEEIKMELTKEELVKFKIWRNEGRKFWARILFWGIWGISSLVICLLLSTLIPKEIMAESTWEGYGAMSVLFFIIAGMSLGISNIVSNSKNKKVQDRKDPKTKAKRETQKPKPKVKPKSETGGTKFHPSGGSS